MNEMIERVKAAIIKTLDEYDERTFGGLCDGWEDAVARAAIEAMNIQAIIEAALREQTEDVTDAIGRA